MLQYITHTNSLFPTPSAGAEAALMGGCRWIQLRMKGADREAVVAEGRKLRALCSAYGATLILDDHAELVNEVGADGVHLGKNDMPVADARALLGRDLIIGATANTADDIRAAADSGADYVGLGPFRFTTTKEKLSPTLGLDGYHRILSQAGASVPVVAIGGITVGDMPELMLTGISGIAVSGAILNATNPIETTKQFISYDRQIENRGRGVRFAPLCRHR